MTCLFGMLSKTVEVGSDWKIVSWEQFSIGMNELDMPLFLCQTKTNEMGMTIVRWEINIIIMVIITSIKCWWESSVSSLIVWLWADEVHIIFRERHWC